MPWNPPAEQSWTPGAPDDGNCTTGIKIPLDYLPHRSGAAEGGGSNKRALSDHDKSASGRTQGGGNSCGMTDAGTPSKSKKKASKSYAFTGPGSHDPGPEDKDLSDVELSQLSQQLQGSERPNSSGGGMISCQDLKDTPLGIYLTNKARGICARDLVIKVVADVPKQTSASKGSGARSGGSADSSAGQGQENGEVR